MKRRVLALSLLFLAAAALAADDDLGGSLTGHGPDGIEIDFPTLWIDVEADVRGDLAMVTTTQAFANPGGEPMSASYAFPLDEMAAVHAMSMQVGDEIVSARIRRVEEARAEFEKARTDGRAASLVVQHRPNVFTQDVANVMPGLPIVVTVRHVQPARRADGAYELVLPLVVGPRFQPQGAPSSPCQSADAPFSAAELEALPAPMPVGGLSAPLGAASRDRVSVTVRLDPGLPLAEVDSPTHALRVEEAEGGAIVHLAEGAVADDRDFVLRWLVADDGVQGAAIVERGADGSRHVSLLLEPPAVPEEASIAARELVFLLDCSGSMSGEPIAATRLLITQALRAARPRDSFRIVRFSDEATELGEAPLPATPENVEAALRHVAGLEASGGTMAASGIAQALAVPAEPGVLRLVFFLTDGYIGNEHGVLRILSEQVGDARLFAVGVGAGVNRYLLSELGRIGRGYTRFVDPTREVPADVVADLVERIDGPLLLDVEVDWGGNAVVEALPERIPDLFAGRSLRILARLEGEPAGPVVVSGTLAGVRIEMEVPLLERDAPEGGSPVAISWGRARVEALMQQLSVPFASREGRVADDLLKARVVELGLEHSLVTQWTSFVAVSEQVVNPDGGAPSRRVPVSQVAGTSSEAYGLRPSPPRSRTVHGTPEASPLVAAAVLLAALGGAFVLLRRP